MSASFKSFLLISLLVWSGCSDQTEVQSDDPNQDVTLEQAVVDATGPNWLLAAEEGLVELAGGQDGEPDVLTGRFVLEGNAINDASSDDERWVLVGNGRLQVVDKDASRLRDVRQVFSGSAVRFIRKAPVGWLIGGDDGHVMRLDAEGEPTETEAQILNNETLVDAAWNGANWLIASSNRSATASSSFAIGTTADILAGKTASAVVTAGEPDSGTPPGWLVFGGDSFEFVRPIGIAEGAQVIAAGLTVTDAVYHNGQIMIGAADGRVGVMDAATRTITTWHTVLDQPVEKIEFTGTEFLVLGASGKVRRLSSTGAPDGPALDLATSRTPVAGWLADGRWLIALGEIGFVEFVGPDLSQLRTLTPVLDGRSIRGGDVSPNGVLAVGDEGRIQLLSALGTSSGPVRTTGNGTLRAASWNGEEFLVVGDNGLAQRVSATGEPQGSPQTLLDGKTIRFATWGRGFWLIGGDDGTFQRVRPDGMPGGATSVVSGASRLYGSRSNTNEWIVAGVNQDGNGLYAVIGSDGNLRGTPSNLPSIPGPIYAVEFNGLEWILGGAGGFLVRLNNEGVSLGNPTNVLNGYDIHNVFYNGVNFLVAGQFGAMRRLGPDLRPIRAPIALANQRDIHLAVWTRPRGFAGGICMTNSSCFNAPCVGGIESGACCDAACDRPCESCVQQDTGLADGTCAPVVAGKQPPLKADGSGAGACRRQAEDTCGFTGSCDGGGECQYYGAEITCGPGACVGSTFTDILSCDGAGTCRAPASENCSPYITCSPVSGCATSCAINADCVDGFECKSGECVQESDPNNPGGPGSGGGDESGDDGCGCSSPNGTPSILLLLLAALAILRRNGARAQVKL